MSVFGFFWSVFSLIRIEYGEIRRDTEYLTVFSLVAGKYGPEKHRLRTLFTQRQVTGSFNFRLFEVEIFKKMALIEEYDVADDFKNNLYSKNVCT